MYPALVNCTTIDLFADWPHDALIEVGERYLSQIDLDTDSKVNSPPTDALRFSNFGLDVNASLRR
jgi:hypothetical protein